MMPKILFVFSLTILISCGHGHGGMQNQQDSSQAIKSANTETTVPGADKLEFTDTLLLEANQNMRFSKELFRVRVGRKLRLILKNTGVPSSMSMSHNVVILQRGTDIADFADIAQKAKVEQYVPSALDSLVIAHTKMVSGGEADGVEFIIPHEGVYDFICSFPGHWGTMQGKIVAE
jgi:azurin